LYERDLASVQWGNLFQRRWKEQVKRRWWWGYEKKEGGKTGIQMVQIRPVFIRINTPPGNARLGNSSVRDLSEPELKLPNVFLRKKA